MTNATDSAIALAKESGIDLATVNGTGQDGRILKGDVQKRIDELALVDDPVDEPSPADAPADKPEADDETAGEGGPDDPADEAQAPPAVDELDSDEPDPDDETAVDDGPDDPADEDPDDEESDDEDGPEEPAPAIPTDTIVPVQLRGAKNATLAGKAIRQNQVYSVTYGHYLAAKQANPGIFAVRLPGSSEFTVE